MPLALRISGGILHSTPALAVATYIARLGDERQRLLALRDPDDPHLNLEASLRLSYAQLDDATQQVFRQLGVFVADFSTSMAHAVVEAPAGGDIEATLQLLLRRNLVMYDAKQARWRLHDLMRDLARSMLEAGEADAAWWRYARAAVQIVEETQAQYEAGGEGVLAALARFDTERPHIDATRTWAAQAGTDAGDRLLLDDAAATADIGRLRYGARRERIPQWERVLAAAWRLGDRRGEGLALHNLGNAYVQLGDVRRAIRYYEQELAIFRALGDRRGEGRALCSLGSAYAELGEAQRPITYLEQALTIAHEMGDRRSEGIALGSLGFAYINLGEAQRAITYLEQHLTIAHEMGDRRNEGIALLNLGHAYAVLGDTQRVIDSCVVAVTIARGIAGQRLEGHALSYLAYTQARQGDLTRATITFEQALVLLRTVGDRQGEAERNWLFGLALAEQGERERALPLLRAAVAYKQEIGHAKAVEHAALLARLEAGEDLPTELLRPAGQRAVGADADAPPDAADP